MLHVELVLAIAHLEMLRKTTKKMGTKNTASTVPSAIAANHPPVPMERWRVAYAPAAEMASGVRPA